MYSKTEVNDRSIIQPKRYNFQMIYTKLFDFLFVCGVLFQKLELSVLVYIASLMYLKSNGKSQFFKEWLFSQESNKIILLLVFQLSHSYYLYFFVLLFCWDLFADMWIPPRIKLYILFPQFLLLMANVFTLSNTGLLYNFSFIFSVYFYAFAKLTVR